jgi:hypothetical protein
MLFSLRFAVCRCFGGLCLSSFQNHADDASPLPQLRPLDRLLPPIARLHCVRQHLPHRITRQPELPGYGPLTAALYLNRWPNTTVYLHLKHASGVP